MRCGQTSLAAALRNFNREEDQRSEWDFLDERIVVEVKFAFSKKFIATVVGHVLCLVLFGVVDVIIFADHDIAENICYTRLVFGREVSFAYQPKSILTERNSQPVGRHVVWLF